MPIINSWNKSITNLSNTGKSLFDGQFILNKWTVLLNKFYTGNPRLSDIYDFVVYDFKQLYINLLNDVYGFVVYNIKQKILCLF